MKVFLIVAALWVISAIEGAQLPEPFTEHCIVGEQNLYPPPENTTVPTFVVDLDKAPYDRWTEISQKYKGPIGDLVQSVKDFISSFVSESIVDKLINELGTLDGKLPQPYADEIMGISNVTGVPLGEIVLYNIFYEIFTVCTSIVAEDPQGKLYHARNLDFGLFLGWDDKTHDWLVTERLRNNIINVDWRKNGRTVFKSVNFAGFVGVYNGVRPKGFTVTANERFDLKNGGYIGIIKWLMGDNSASWMTLLVREVMENATSYDEAVQRLSNTKLMAPVYYIVGGNSSGQGSIIVRSRTETLDVVNLNLTDPNGWYILETNYDPKSKPLFIDDRRTPGNECMRKLGRDKVDFAGIFNVLSSTTNLNKLTAYTTLMQVDEGTLETYIQKCPDPCWAF
jgi:acid ceramidase